MKRLLILICCVVILLGATLAAIASPSPGLTEGSWPMFQHDPQHTGRSPFRGPEVPDLKWAITIPQSAHLYSAPVIGPSGTIYVSGAWWYETPPAFLHAINPDGSIQWQFEVGGAILGAPAVAADGTIYFGSLDSKVYALGDR